MSSTHTQTSPERTKSDLTGTTTIVVGASRGLGRGIATAFAEAGAPVVAVSRSAAVFPDPADGAGAIQPEIADATDATVAGSTLERHYPQAVVVVAGASPHLSPLQEQTWETFSVNWHTDVQIAFHLAARGPSQAAATWRQGDRDQQRSRDQELTAQRRVRRRQGYAALSPRATRRTRHGAPAWTSHSAPSCLGSRRWTRSAGPRSRRTPRAPLRRGAPRADRPAGHAGERRRRAGRALQADAATVAPAYLLTGAGLQKCAEQVDRAGTVTTTNQPERKWRNESSSTACRKNCPRRRGDPRRRSCLRDRASRRRGARLRHRPQQREGPLRDRPARDD
jgi:short chain dehydrogenase